MLISFFAERELHFL